MGCGQKAYKDPGQNWAAAGNDKPEKWVQALGGQRKSEQGVAVTGEKSLEVTEDLDPSPSLLWQHVSSVEHR